MATLPRRSLKKRAPRRRRLTTRPRRKMMRRTRSVAERASCKEIYTIDNMSSNTPYKDIEQNLGLYKRASQIAQNYQFFRIKYVKYKFLCRYNTYQATTAEATAFPLPYLHYMVDKAGALPTGTSIAQLKAEGAIPIKFTKDLTVAWKPGVSLTTEAANSTAQYSTAYKVSPWLMTNLQPGEANWVVNDTDHKGLYWYMETATLPGDGTYEFDAEVEVFFEFKKPLLTVATGQPEAISVQSHMAQQIALGKSRQQVHEHIAPGA